jgi:hypothetical protein
MLMCVVLPHLKMAVKILHSFVITEPTIVCPDTSTMLCSKGYAQNSLPFVLTLR